MSSSNVWKKEGGKTNCLCCSLVQPGVVKVLLLNWLRHNVTPFVMQLPFLLTIRHFISHLQLAHRQHYLEETLFTVQHISTRRTSVMLCVRIGSQSGCWSLMKFHSSRSPRSKNLTENYGDWLRTQKIHMAEYQLSSQVTFINSNPYAIRTKFCIQPHQEPGYGKIV